MAAWTSSELSQFGDPIEVNIAPRRRDGALGRSVIVWVVRHGNDLYVRSWKGNAGGWYQAVQRSHEGRIEAGGASRDVSFVEEAEARINDGIDVAYRTKYHGRSSDAVEGMVRPEARATTLKLVPAASGDTRD